MPHATRLAVVTLLVLAGAACSNNDNKDEATVELNDLNLATIETAVDETSPGLKKGDRLLDAAVGADGVLYLALRDAEGHHRLISTRGGPEPLVLADESTVEGFSPTAVATDSRLRIVYVASGDGVLALEDHHGAQGSERRLVDRIPSGTPGPAAGSAPASTVIGPPRYLTFYGRTRNLYMADFCRIVRYETRRYEVFDVAEVAGGPGADCSANPARITGLAIDQRTGDIFVGRGDEVLRVGADGKLSPVMAKEDRDDAVAKPVEGLLYGRSLAVNSVGDVLVATTGKVLRVRADGTLGKVHGFEEGPNESHSVCPATNSSSLATRPGSASTAPETSTSVPASCPTSRRRPRSESGR